MSDDETAMVVRKGAPTALVPSGMDQAIKLANLMSESSLIPEALRGKPADCFLVVEQATRWGMSPFAVAQCTSVIKGKLMFEGKLVAAVVNALGNLEKDLDYTYTGSGQDRTCRVFATKRGEKEPREVTVVFKDVRTTNGCWQSQPDQQLAYSGSRVWARRHAPELMLGVYAPEEPFDDEAPRIVDSRRCEACGGLFGQDGKRAMGDPRKCEECAGEEPGGPKGGSAPTAIGPATTATGPTATPASTGDSAGATDAEFAFGELGIDDGDDLPEDHYPKKGEFRDDVECWVWVGAKGNKKWGEGPGEWRSTGMEPQRSLAQNARIHAMRGERGYDDPTWRSKLAARFNKHSSADLSVREAGELMEAMAKATALHGTADQKKARQEERAKAVGRELADEFGKELIR